MTVVASMTALTAVAPSSGAPDDGPEAPVPSTGGTGSPDPSRFFSTVDIEEYGTVSSPSGGDLWPSCWGADGDLYAAHGDGRGFSEPPGTDIGVNRITGTPEAGNLSGELLAAGDAIGKIWSGPEYNRKPTGMACVGGDLYLAVQDLKKHTFDEAPAATIVKSTDGGRTWTSDRSEPMFDDSVFTTIMFLDYGQDYRNAEDGYVYAYGLDNNWRQQTDVFLARVPQTSVQDRSSWQFYAGSGPRGPRWSAQIDDRVPAIHDDERVYRERHTLDALTGVLRIAQGGVVYNEPLDRYLYSTWNAFNWTLYDAPTPWGPWTKIEAKDFGPQWSKTKHGGYATTIPSKFISDDGTSMWMQANVCGPCGAKPDTAYNFNLRRLTVEPTKRTAPRNRRDADRNLAQEPGTTTAERVNHFGHPEYLHDQKLEQHEDDWNDEVKSDSWWGYTWPRRYKINEVTYTTGEMRSNGGWFAEDLRVQVRRHGRWVDVDHQRVTPDYPYDKSAGSHTSYTFWFRPTVGDGVRIIGRPGGKTTYTSIAELQAHYR